MHDKNATSVTVVNENRTIPVVNGVFTDTFATAATVHIYEVNDGPAPSPPPSSAPNAPTISPFSPDMNGVDTTNSIKLKGPAVEYGTVTVFYSTTGGRNGACYRKNWLHADHNGKQCCERRAYVYGDRHGCKWHKPGVFGIYSYCECAFCSECATLHKSDCQRWF